MASKKFRKFKHRAFNKKLHPDDNPNWPARNSLVEFISQSMQELQYRAFDAKKTYGPGVLVCTFDARNDSTSTHWLGYGSAKDLTKMFSEEMAGHLWIKGEEADRTGATVMICEYINPFGGSQRATLCIDPAPRPGGTTEPMAESSFSVN